MNSDTILGICVLIQILTIIPLFTMATWSFFDILVIGKKEELVFNIFSAIFLLATLIQPILMLLFLFL